MSVLNMTQGLNLKLKPGIPEIHHMPDQRMVVIPIHGDPNQETEKLMPQLYAMAYGIRKIYKEKGIPFKVEKLRGRWPDFLLDIAKSDWFGFYGLPVPNDVDSLPVIKAEKQIFGTPSMLENWQYGTVAQILHVGSYAEEQVTVRKLYDFIEANGYCVIKNSHEEIYLSDPQKTASDKLKTIILYRLEKI